MTDLDRDGLNLDDPDRLPWLETADGYEYDTSTSPMKVAALVLAGLALLAAIVGGIYWIQRNQTSGTEGNGELIAAQEGAYKVEPADKEGKAFEGEGDTAFAASEGKKATTPVGVAEKSDTAKSDTMAPGGSKTATDGPVPAGAALVQLGAYGDAATADQAWSALGKRFGFLSGVNRKIAEASIEGGRKVFRLQAITGDAAAAQQLCAKLKAAGESCLIVK